MKLNNKGKKKVDANYHDIENPNQNRTRNIIIRSAVTRKVVTEEEDIKK